MEKIDREMAEYMADLCTKKKKKMKDSRATNYNSEQNWNGRNG